MKSGPEEATDGIARQIEESGADQPYAEFRQIPADAAICSAWQQEPGSIAEAFLRAVAIGDDDDGAVSLATALADAVLDASGAKLAQSVLDGGPLTVTRAIRLAELVLTWSDAAGKVGAL